MENKLESPDQMDISEAGTTCDNISTSSASPTISNRANESDNSNEINIISTVTNNMNSIQLKRSSTIENRENRNILTLDTNIQQQHHSQKLTPVHHHPLMIDFENDTNRELRESSNKANVSNFPDVVLAHHQPRVTRQPASKNQVTADLVISVNNNHATKIRKPIYREPSPVSNHRSDLSLFLV